jgi:D-alanyl-D-alanine carboxypeptidase
MIDTRRLKELSVAANCGVAIAIRVNGVIACNHVVDCQKAPIGHQPAALRFPIYSITKTLTAVCMLRMQEAGLLRLEASFWKWPPGSSLPESITLAHLLRHTSGLPDYGSMPEYHAAVRNSPSSPWATSQFLDVALQRGLLFQPGAGWSYSNIGYMLLRQVVEVASGVSFRDALIKHVTAPAGLQDTFVADGIEDWSTCVPGYSSEVDPDRNLVDIRETAWRKR